MKKHRVSLVRIVLLVRLCVYRSSRISRIRNCILGGDRALDIRQMRQYFSTLILLLAPLLVACSNSQELLGNLDTQQSIEVMVALGRSGLQADRIKTSSGRNERYQIIVHRSEYSKALQLLHEYGLPKGESDSIESFTRPSGFTPNTPEISSLRLDHALELRIERMLAALDGIVEARAVVSSVNSNDASSSGPAASVILRYTSPDQNLPFRLEEAQQMVARAVPGMSVDQVKIQTSRVVLPEVQGSNANLVRVFPLGIRMAVEDKEYFLFQLLALCVGFALSGLVVGAYWSAWSWRRAQQRAQRQRARSLSGDAARSIFIEAAADGNARTKASLPPVQDPGA